MSSNRYGYYNGNRYSANNPKRNYYPYHKFNQYYNDYSFSKKKWYKPWQNQSEKNIKDNENKDMQWHHHGESQKTESRIGNIQNDYMSIPTTETDFLA